LIPALAFMFASTKLVIELGAVLWLLMCCRFVLAEVIGAFVLIRVMWLLMAIFFPKKLEAEARRYAGAEEKDDGCHHDHEHHDGHESANRLRRLANAFWAIHNRNRKSSTFRLIPNNVVL
jgi:hypothetical protein